MNNKIILIDAYLKNDEDFTDYRYGHDKPVINPDEAVDHHIRNALQILDLLTFIPMTDELLDRVVIDVNRHLIDLTMFYLDSPKAMYLGINASRVEDLMNEHELSDIVRVRESLVKLYYHLDGKGIIK